MARKYRINFGRKTVKPFQENDINNMIIICKKKRNEAEKNNDIEQKYLWDRNYMILVLGMNLAFRIEDILQLRVDNFHNGGIYTREFKTNKEQSFVLHPSLYKDIQGFINRNDLIDGQYLFRNYCAKPGELVEITRNGELVYVNDKINLKFILSRTVMTSNINTDKLSAALESGAL